MAPLRNVGRVLALGRADRRLLLRAYAGLGLMELGLRTVGFRRVVRRAQAPIRAPRVPRAEDLARARRYAHWLDVASRHHVVRARCLHRSLVLHWWLRREGLPSELRIGVLKERDALKAHAWVDLGGRVVNDTPGAVAPFAPLAPRGERPVASGESPHGG